MLMGIIGGLIGAVIYQVVKSLVFKPKPATPKAIPVSRKCACGHKSNVHHDDGNGRCDVLLGTKGHICACKRFTFPEDY